MSDIFANRRSGILLHPSSLPGPKRQGKLNHEAFNFIDFLADCASTVWQVLPLSPTHEDGSPYQSYSRFALDQKLLDLSSFLEYAWLPKKQLELCIQSAMSVRCFRRNFELHADTEHLRLFSRFEQYHLHWLHDYALYQAGKRKHNGLAWYDWPQGLRDRNPSALDELAKSEAEEIVDIKFVQFLLFSVWQRIRAYAAAKHIAIFGDLPLFVSHDSADVWANPCLFDLDKEGMPLHVAGVPPDYFSKKGQRWGNPHYNWQRMAEDEYQWWISGVSHHFELFDLVRLDHFRGLEAYWKIPAKDQYALSGYWEIGPGKNLFSLLAKALGPLPLVAEDLGFITPDVEQLLKEFNLPGMKVLQFAFNSDAYNPYLPHNHCQHSVVYTGTHDNDTTLGWFNKLDQVTKQHCLQYLNYPVQAMPWPLIHSALASVAKVAIIPMQDILSLDSACRMNTPGTSDGNWHWRMRWSDVPSSLPSKLRSLNELYGRTGHLESNNY